MIAKLTGVVDDIAADSAVVDAGGVGYLIYASRRTLGRLGPPGGRVSVLVETHVREDHIHLYGFIDKAERDWFRLLTTVQGVGGRVALAILGVLDPDALATAIAAQDKAPLIRADGVGPKLAGRIVAELRDRAGAAIFSPAAPAPAPVGAPAVAADPTADAVSALVNLGYGRADAFAAVATAARTLGDGAAIEAIIPAALKELAP